MKVTKKPTDDELKKIIIDYISRQEFAPTMTRASEANLMPAKKLRSLVMSMIDSGELQSTVRSGCRYFWTEGMKFPKNLENRLKEEKILNLLASRPMSVLRIASATSFDWEETRDLIRNLVRRQLILRRVSGEFSVTGRGLSYLDAQKEKPVKTEPIHQDLFGMMTGLCSAASSPIISSGTAINACF